MHVSTDTYGPKIPPFDAIRLEGSFLKWASLVAQMVKNSSAMQTWIQSLGWEAPLEKGMATHSRILECPGEFHGQRSLYSPCGRKKSNMTECLTLSVSAVRYANTGLLERDP